MKLGLPPGAAFYLLVFSIFGSAINLPIKTFYTEGDVFGIRVQDFYGFLYPIVVWERGRRRTILALNIGGALVPLTLSAFLILKFGAIFSWRVLVGISVVTLVCWKLARPVPGVGIVMPAPIPPIVSALVATFLGGGNTAALAYVSGVVGVLLGADLMNMRKVYRLGAPVVSIGGAGTFDGIFLTGIFSVLLV